MLGIWKTGPETRINRNHITNSSGSDQVKVRPIIVKFQAPHEINLTLTGDFLYLSLYIHVILISYACGA